MRLTDEQYEFIKGEVVALFERYDIKCLPINGFEIAYKMGIKLIPYSSLNQQKFDAVMQVSLDGFYLEDLSGNDIIYYNDTVSYDRMNMTILHEIGHCVLDHKGNSEEEETEAGFFAKYAAAPPPLIHFTDARSPQEIEDTFGISYTASHFAYNYYRKWLLYGGRGYKDYEIRLLLLFHAA